MTEEIKKSDMEDLDSSIQKAFMEFSYRQAKIEDKMIMDSLEKE